MMLNRNFQQERDDADVSSVKMAGVVIDSPTRYVAFKNPGVWIEHEALENRGGFEWAAYSEPYQNVYYEHLGDGIFIEICSFQGKWFLLECHMTMPDVSRKQYNLVKRYVCYKRAKTAALKWLMNMRKILKSA